ncbi:arylsulfatase [Seonamhaeicola sp.]|uniref:arylsulfatase B n=1 Tax=Seonamhaeicola sp. TaxID=1912245 RepID=UPI002617B7F7|nr:arylsulfatase [Seonamhaeicola sp.]
MVIVGDDLGWNDVSFHGSDISTPNIDELATDSYVFNRFYVTPKCSPTRAGFMTGKYPNRFGMRYGVISPPTKNGLPPEEITFPEYLANYGYNNRAAFGKWHLGHSSIKFHPLNQGFNYFYGHYNGAIDYFTHKRNAELDWHKNFNTSYDKGYSTDLVEKEVIRYIDSVKTRSPFFAYVAFNAPHSPMQAKQEELLKYGYDPQADHEDFPVGGMAGQEREKEIYGKQGRGNNLRQTFSAMVSSLDYSIGNIVDYLKKEGLYDNTIIWFFSDNGGVEYFGGNNKPLRGQKHTEWEGGVRVVSMLKGIGVKNKFQEVNQVVSYIDVFPTLADMVIKKPEHEMDGISVKSRLEGEKLPKRNLYLGNKAVVNDTFKLVRGELFKISEDISETNNVEEEYPEVYQDLLAVADSFKTIEKGEYKREPKEWLPPREWKMPR